MAETGSTALGAFLRRLLLRSELSAAEQQAVLELPCREVRVQARRDLVRPGETTRASTLTADGLLGRFDLMRSGARQITAIYMRGDMCDLQSVVAPVAGWGITALSPATVVQVGHDELARIARMHPNLLFAFWRDAAVDASILSKWVANIGRKDARARIAHLLCEFGERAAMMGLGARDDYDFPLIQEQVGDLTGLTGVHVNRSLQALKEAGLVTVSARRVRIHDWAGLAGVAEFATDYLVRDARQSPGGSGAH